VEDDKKAGGDLFEATYSRRVEFSPGLESIELGGPGNVWLVNSLWSGKTLARYVLDRGRFFEVKSGHTFTICPKGARPGHLLDFTLASVRFTESAERHVYQYIAERCGLGSQLLVAEDSVARPSDPWLANETAVRDLTFSFGEELYHWRRPGDPLNGSAILQDVLQWTGGYPMNAFAISRDAGRIAGPRAIVSRKDLESLAVNVEAIITRAYDGQGFVIWVAG
jgi:hypothetical protein